MTMAQITRFIEEVIACDKPMYQISVMGGEPMVHPHVEWICKEIHTRLVLPGLVQRFNLATNGTLPIPEWMREHMKILLSPVESKHHRRQFVAPIDTGQDTKSCKIPATCGIALNRFGYYPCGAGGAIVRLFRLPNLTKYALPENVEAFGDLHPMCQLCQVSAVTQQMATNDEHDAPSRLFQAALAYQSRNPYRPVEY